MTRRGGLARLWRRNWPEATATGAAVFLAVTGVLTAAEGKHAEGGGLIFLAVFSWCLLAAGWLRGIRRQYLPMREAVDEIHAGVSRMVGTLEAGAAAAGPSGPPRLSVVPPGR
jgi:hypothetical protein